MKWHLLSLWNCILVRWILTRTFAYDQSRFFVGTLDYLAQSNTGIRPAGLQNIYFLYAGIWQDLKRKERMLICKFLKDCVNGRRISVSVNYFSNFLPPPLLQMITLVPHSLSKVFVWFHCALIVSLPATPIFLKPAIFSWRTPIRQCSSWQFSVSLLLSSMSHYFDPDYQCPFIL